MLAYAVTGASGWLMMVLLLAIVLYPLLLRAGMLGPIQPFFKRLRLHYWMAYTFAGVLLLHLWVSMSGALALGTSALGLDLATIALVLVLVQIALGWQLRAPARSRRRVLRRRHFWVMLALVACVLAHVALNSGTLRMLFAI